MPVLAISAVDHTTDTITTTTPHGLTTGDGFIAIYSPDGGTIPAGLAPVTDYWAIVTGATTLKLASSSANALAGTAIDITSNGSGTLQLLHGLPYRVPTIAAPLSVLKSAHLNATWESLVALWNLLTGQAQTVFDRVKLAVAIDSDLAVSGMLEADGLYFTTTQTKQLDIHGTGYGSFGTTNSGDKQSTGASQIVDVCIDLPLGAKVWGYSFRYSGNGVDNLSHKLVKIADGVETDVGAATINAPPASWATAVNNFAPVDVALGERLVIRVTSGGSGQRVAAPAVDWTRPKP